MKELEACPATPDGTTIQDIFDEIALTTKGNQIIIISKITALNIGEGKSALWTATDYFEWDGNEIKLKNKKNLKLKEVLLI